MSGNLLAKWIIGKAEKSEAYRAGTLTGMKHPKPDRRNDQAAGGLPELIRQADELEKSGYIRTEKSKSGRGYEKNLLFHRCHSKAVRKRRNWRSKKAAASLYKTNRTTARWGTRQFLEGYYDEIIRRLELGEIVKSPDMEDVDFSDVWMQLWIWKNLCGCAYSVLLCLMTLSVLKKDYEKKVVKYWSDHLCMKRGWLTMRY